MYRYLIICSAWHLLGASCVRNDDGEEDKGGKYKFEYSVDDSKSGNRQWREEERREGSLKGRYSAHFPDGFKRTVVYSVDGDSGFVATVHKEKIHTCYNCLEANPFSIGYEIHHRSPDSHVRSFFYMDSGTAASEVKVESHGTRIHSKTKHLPPSLHFN